MLGELLLIALGTLASEDLTLAATGLLIAQGKLGFLQGVAACVAGIFTGDMLIYCAGRAVGLGVRRWSLLTHLVPAHAVARGTKWVEERGATAVFVSRFTPGLRLPTYFAAGLLPTKMTRFAGYFLLAALVWTPLLVGAAGWLGAGFLKTFFAAGSSSALAFAAALGTIATGTALFRFTTRRRIAGFLKRKIRWEFWPTWAAYLPLVPYFLYLAIRHRSLALFTAANPGMFSGGFVGESKSTILRELSSEADLVAAFEAIPWTLGPCRRLERAAAFAESCGWPIVMKPDIGERGAGVAVVRSRDELESYLDRETGDVIVQRYVPGLEFGIFYYRRPQEAHGHIFSITEKQFPVIVGDGVRTLRELILTDDRAVCQAQTYFQLTKHNLEAVPDVSEKLQLVELGSHCRGAIFLNGMRHVTPQLSEAIDRVSQAHTGFHFGRFDVRAASIEALRAGQFRVIELNGVSSEATHIYDPAVSLASAYRTMFHQWRMAFEIGAENRRCGAEPMPLRDLFHAITNRRNAS